jgi:hypothetical protein
MGSVNKHSTRDVSFHPLNVSSVGPRSRTVRHLRKTTGHVVSVDYIHTGRSTGRLGAGTAQFVVLPTRQEYYSRLPRIYRYVCTYIIYTRPYYYIRDQEVSPFKFDESFGTCTRLSDLFRPLSQSSILR